MNNDLLSRLKNMESGFLTDSMKVLGLDGWMDGLHPVNVEHRICGKAFTMQFTFEADPGAKGYSYYELLDEISPGDVIILAAGACPYAIMGENMQHAAKKMGAAGIVLDGTYRDHLTIRSFNLPVFARNNEIRFMPGNFKITYYNVPVMCAGIVIRPGDYVFGDADGLIALPPEKMEQVVYQAEFVAEVEKEMELAIKSGKSMKECAALISTKKQLRK